VNFKGYGFWHYFIKLLVKKHEDNKVILSMLWLCMFGAVGGSVAVLNYACMISGIVIIAMV